jgi:hypothetical protein
MLSRPHLEFDAPETFSLFRLRFGQWHRKEKGVLVGHSLYWLNDP